MLIAIGIAAVVVTFLASFLRGARNAERRKRWQDEQSAWQEQRGGRARDQRLAHLPQYFPTLRAALQAALAHSLPALDAVRAVLESAPGVRVGTGLFSLPAVYLDADATRHLLIASRTGGGKTFILRSLRYRRLQQSNVAEIGFEHNPFKTNILPNIPLERAKATVYWRIADPECPIGLNIMDIGPEDDPAQFIGDLYHVWKQACEEGSIGGRSEAIVWNTFSALVGSGASLRSIPRFLEDEPYRRTILDRVTDEEVLRFWTRSFPRFTGLGSAIQPFLSRVTRFLTPTIRRALAPDRSTFSLGQALDSGILLVDLGGLPPAEMRLAAQIILARIQLCFAKRDRLDELQRPITYLFIDEVSVIASISEYTIKELCSRSRRQGVAMAVSIQNLSSLPLIVQSEVLANFASLIVLSTGAKQAATLRRELLVPSGAGGAPVPIAAERLVASPVGCGYMRCGTGALAMPVRFAPPPEDGPVAHGEQIKEISWVTHGTRSPRSIVSVPAVVGPVDVARAQADSPAGAALLDESPTASGPLRPSRPTPPRRLTSPSQAAVSPPPALASVVEEPRSERRPSSQHTYLQHLVCEWGVSKGFKVTREKPTLGGLGRVDVDLERDDLRIAVEVCVTSTPQQEQLHAWQNLAAGYDHILVLAGDARTAERVKRILEDNRGDESSRRVEVLTAEAFFAFVESLVPAAGPHAATNGYAVRVKHRPLSEAEATGRRQAVSRVILRSLKRLEGEEP